MLRCTRKNNKNRNRLTPPTAGSTNKEISHYHFQFWVFLAVDLEAGALPQPPDAAQ